MLYAKQPPETKHCERCNGERTYHVHLEDISNVGHFALWFAMALIGGPTSPAATKFQKGYEREQMSEEDKQAALRRGADELMELCLLDCERTGEGGLEPKVLHLERIFERHLLN